MPDNAPGFATAILDEIPSSTRPPFQNGAFKCFSFLPKLADRIGVEPSVASRTSAGEASSSRSLETIGILVEGRRLHHATLKDIAVKQLLRESGL